MARNAAIPASDLEQIRRFCAARTATYEDRIRVEETVRGNSVTILERRPPRRPRETEWTRTAVAQLRYDAAVARWSLYSPNGQGRWDRYSPRATARVEELLDEIERDPTGILWG